MKNSSKRLIPFSVVMLGFLAIHWLSGEAWVRSPNLAAYYTLALLASLLIAAYPGFDDE